MTAKRAIPLNTLEATLTLARALTLALRKRDSRTCRNYRIFAALTADDLEALTALIIWQARGQMVKELIQQ